MASSDKRASLGSGLLAAKEQMPSGEGDAQSAPPSASLFALPRGGARQRLVEALRRSEAEAASEPGAAPPQAPEEAVEPPASDSVLASKGDASASGFRPWYWSYEREGNPPPSDMAGTVTQFPAGAPSPVSPPDPVSAPATPSHAPRRGAKLMLSVLAGFSGLALAGSATLYILSRSETPSPAAPPGAAVIAPALPMAPPAPPPPKLTPVVPLTRAPPAETAPRAHHLSAAEIAELIGRGDQTLATGDIAAARLFYERAAESGSAAAARQVGKTYDPLFLAAAQARGIRGDPVAAARWYRKASAGGDKEADALMKRLIAAYAG